MNKQKGIIIGVLALAVTMMVGYAIFSETITINGTATAKGDFSFEITTQKEVPEIVKTSSMYAILSNFGTTGDLSSFDVSSPDIESSITNATNTVTYKAAFTNPGQKQYFTVKVTNTGSIPINIDIYNDITTETNITGNLIMNDGRLFDVNKVEDAVRGGDDGGYDFSVTDVMSINALEYKLVSLYDIFVPKKIYDELEADDNALPKLETGESLYLIFDSHWEPDLNFNSRVVGIDVSATSTITIPIKQATN